jgi:hypothetical protein
MSEAIRDAGCEMRDLLRPIGIEETLLALRLRNQPAPKIEPEDWSVLDLLLLPRKESVARESTPIDANRASGKQCEMAEAGGAGEPRERRSNKNLDFIGENSRPFAGKHSPGGTRS